MRCIETSNKSPPRNKETAEKIVKILNGEEIADCIDIFANDKDSLTCAANEYFKKIAPKYYDNLLSEAFRENNLDLFKKVRLPMGVKLRSPSGSSGTNSGNSEQAQWKSSISTIEPKRIVTDISVEEGFPRKKETTVNIKIIPTH